jgi:hypothetical protein
MILFFSKNIPNKTSQTNTQVSSIGGVDSETKFGSVAQPVAQFFTPTQPPPRTCKYPINISELFPYWLQKDSGDSASLITLTDAYYQWLSCYTKDINEVSFFRLEDLTDLEQMPGDYVKYLASTYLNSLPSEYINSPGYTGGIVDEKDIKNLIDNVKINLYSRKGTDESFKLVINELFGVEPERISVSYPKKYVMRLNSGTFDWMQTETGVQVDNPTIFNPEITASYLNFSVLYDANDIWQDYSYVVNVSGLSPTNYETVVRPLVHPAGTSDFFQIRQDILNNVQTAVTAKTYETPIVINYRGYTLGSFSSLDTCYPGFTSAPTYTFPSWDEEISVKYYSGMTFGMINIKDFVLLSPLAGFTFPNETRSVTVCP